MLYLLGQEEGIYFSFLPYITAQKKFSSKGFFSKCEVILSFLRIWSHLMKKFSMENFIFCAVYIHQVPTKHPQEKTLDPRKYPREKIWTHEIPTRKKFGPTKYPRKKISDPWRHGGLMARGPTRPTMSRDPQNLTHSIRRRESWKTLKIIKLYTDKIFSALYLPS